MIRRLLPVCLLLAATGQSNVDPMVADVARRPLNLPTGTGDFRSLSVRAEGRTLVAHFEIVPELSDVVTPEMVGSTFASSICTDSRYRTFFSDGRTLRVELVAGNGQPAITVVDRCPASPGGGLTAATFAQAMQVFVGRETDGVTMMSIRAEGETVIFLVDGAAGWRDASTSEMLAAAYLSNFCDQANGHQPFFNGIRMLRFDTLEAGEHRIEGRPIARCPGR